MKKRDLFLLLLLFFYLIGFRPHPPVLRDHTWQDLRDCKCDARDRNQASRIQVHSTCCIITLALKFFIFKQPPFLFNVIMKSCAHFRMDKLHIGKESKNTSFLTSNSCDGAVVSIFSSSFFTDNSSSCRMTSWNWEAPS